MGPVLLSRLRHREDRDERAAFEALVERHLAFGDCEDRVVFAHANALTRPPLRAALAHDDVAWDGRLAAKEFHAKTTARAVATVS